MQILELPAGDPRWAQALPVLTELRPHLTPELLQQVLAEGAPQGLRFTGLFDGEECVAVAGWRIMANTSRGRQLFVDDLATTANARSQGNGRSLLGHLTHVARAAGCASLELDSGVQRFAAHRFYLRERMNIVAHHFRLQLQPE